MKLPKITDSIHFRGPTALNLALTTFSILALELAVIRWSSGQVRILAYFNNIILIGAFLGMGLGIALGKKYSALAHLAMPCLAVLSAIFCFSEELGIMRIQFFDPTKALWGAERAGTYAQLLGSVFFVLFIFWMVAGTFAFLAAPVGVLFDRMKSLRAYSYDLLGSLAGVLAFALLTACHAPTPLWFAMGCIPFLWLSRKLTSYLAVAAVLVFTFISVDGAYFSPYNRIDLKPIPSADGGGRNGYLLQVNRDFHQFMHDLSDEYLEKTSDRETKYIREVYDLPFNIHPQGKNALVVGAGTGNDVMAALRKGYNRVVSVDIDPTIIRLGKQYHPEKPYDDIRVIPVVNDARNFFETYRGEPFDVVCFGLLDSHSMFSSMSSLRLENFVYTVEGIRAAWNLVGKEGYLAISFSVFAGEWISNRMLWTIQEATGITPIMIDHRLHYGRTYLVPRQSNALSAATLAALPVIESQAKKEGTWIMTDDWPFPYIRMDNFPLGYILLLGLILVTGLLSVRSVYGRRVSLGTLDFPMFFLGAGFLLLETRGITKLSLLFGMTWVVNVSVFSGILILAMAANGLVIWRKPKDPRVWFLPLFASLLLVVAVEPSTLLAFPYWVRGLFGGILVVLPVGFAGIIFSILLRRSRAPSISLGSNILGALLGGTLEYLSMYVGLRGVTGLAIVLYLMSLILISRQERERDGTSRVIPATESSAH